MDFPVYSFEILGVRVYAYGLALAFGGLAALVTLCIHQKRWGMKPGSAGLMALLGGLIGLFCSRLLFSLISYNRLFFDAMDGAWLGIMPYFRLRDGGLSLFGFLFGWLIAGAILARSTQQPARTVMDWLALPTALLVATARFGEILGGMGYGEEMPQGLQFFPLSVMNSFEEWYLAVFMLEGFAALLIALYLRRVDAGERKKDRAALLGAQMLRLLILFSASQVFFESLRQDAYLRLESNAFIRVGQVLGALVLITALVILITRAGKDDRVRVGLLGSSSLLFAALCAAAAEFNEKLPFPRELLYALSLSALSLHAWVELRAIRRVQSSKL